MGNNCDNCRKLGQTILMLQKCLEEKNKELDALGYVWCDGICKDGTYRYTEGELTLEMLQRAQRQVKRMERRLRNQGIVASQQDQQ